MIKTIKENITVYQSENIESCNGVTHFFSTRKGGVSTGVFQSLNFGTHHGEIENMQQNLELFKQSMGFSNIRFVVPHQTHSDVVAVVNESNYEQDFFNTDALLTNLPDVMVCIKTADCVPILLFDPIKKVVGAVHSGWRGTAQNIIGKAIVIMNIEFGCLPADIYAIIGPCIGQAKYEIGEEVKIAIEPLLSRPENVLSAIDSKTGKSYLNLTEANHQLLELAGIKKEKIDSAGLCTFSLPDEFYSARRDGHVTGRMINGIAIKKSN
jgi:polyphenol oxidase